MTESDESAASYVSHIEPGELTDDELAVKYGWGPGDVEVTPPDGESAPGDDEEEAPGEAEG